MSLINPQKELVDSKENKIDDSKKNEANSEKSKTKQSPEEKINSSTEKENEVNQVNNDAITSNDSTENGTNEEVVNSAEESTENNVDENMSNELAEGKIDSSAEKEFKEIFKDTIAFTNNTATKTSTEVVNPEGNKIIELSTKSEKLKTIMVNEILEDKRIIYFAKTINYLTLSGTQNYKKIGDILIEARKELGKKRFTKLLESREIGLERTQARNYMKFSKFISEVEANGGTTPEIYRLGCDKVVQISRIKDKKAQNNLITLALEENLSVRPLKKVVKKLLKNSELTPADALEEVKNEPKKNNKTAEKTSDASNEENEDFRKKYLDLQDKYNQLQTEHQRVLKEYELLKQNASKEEGNSDNA